MMMKLLTFFRTFFELNFNSEKMSVLDYGADLIEPGHLRIAQDQHKRLRSKIEQMVRNKQLPESGFNAAQIEQIITEFANGDTNNFVGKVGAGEREGRVFSSLGSYNLVQFKLTTD